MTNPSQLRDQLQEKVIADLLGPANGPEEIVDEGTVRDRYLVGKLGPKGQSLLTQTDETAPDIARLRQLHVAMDEAVAAAYGWQDIPLDHGWHETRQGPALHHQRARPPRSPRPPAGTESSALCGGGGRGLA